MRCAIGFATLLAMVGALAAGDARGADEVAVYLDRPNQPVTHVSSADAAFTTMGDATEVLVVVGSPFFNFYFFSARPGETLDVGLYEDATRAPFNQLGPGLDAIPGCNVLTGRFVVLELERDATGELARFAVDFEEHCEDGIDAYMGALRFHSDVPIGRPCGDDADRDGEADATDRCLGTTVGETVDDAGCSVAQYCGGIQVADAAGRRMCRAADWLNDGAGRRRARRDCRLHRELDGTKTCVPRDPAARPDAALTLDSEPGEPISAGVDHLFTRADAWFEVRERFGPVVAEVSPIAGGPSWTVTLAGPDGAPLAPGRYVGVGAWPHPPAGAPGLQVTGNSVGCGIVTGWFEIQDIVYAPPNPEIDFAVGDRIDRLDATFEHHCEGQPEALRGSIHYVRPVRHGLTCLDRDADGQPDATDLCPGTPAAAATDEAGCSAAQFCAAVDLAPGNGSICATADWRGDSPRRRPLDCQLVEGVCESR